MKNIIFYLIILLSHFFNGCTNSTNNELYGTYIRNIDSGLLYSKLIIYPENNYSFYSSSCLSSNKDSGTIVFQNDTIYFSSNKKELDNQ